MSLTQIRLLSFLVPAALHGPLRSSSSLTILEDGKACDPPASNIRSTLVRMKNTVVLDPENWGCQLQQLGCPGYYGTSKMNLRLPQNKFPIQEMGLQLTQTRSFKVPQNLSYRLISRLSSPQAIVAWTMSIFPWTRHSGSALQGPQCPQ